MVPAELSIAALIVVEILGGTVDPRLGALGAAILLLIFANMLSFGRNVSSNRVLPALLVIALVQLLNVAVPFGGVSIGTRCLLVGGPTLVAAGLAARAARMSLRSFRLNRPWTQMLIAATGVPLSLLAYVILSPRRPMFGSAAAEIAAASSLVVFSALPEEFIYRVLLLDSATSVWGSRSPWLASAVFAAAYAGTRSIPFVVFAGVVGGAFSLCYLRTRCILGPVLAHGIISVGTFLIWPHMWAR